MAHRRRGDAIEGVPRVALKRARGQAPVKVLGRVLVGVGAGEHVAEHVTGIGEVLDDIAGTGEDRGQALGLDVEALGSDDAVAGGLLAANCNCTKLVATPTSYDVVRVSALKTLMLVVLGRSITGSTISDEARSRYRARTELHSASEVSNPCSFSCETASGKRSGLT